MSDCPETSISGGTAMQSYSKGSAVCCCLLLHLHTTNICPSTPICKQRTCTDASVMVISTEQQANVGQWINTSLKPDPPDRQAGRAFEASKKILTCSFLYFPWLLGSLPRLLLLPHIVFVSTEEHHAAHWLILISHFKNISECFIKEHTALSVHFL